VSYSVRWNRRSLDALADLWIDSPLERDAIREAAESVDRLLQDRPAEQGESRLENERILFAHPLVVSFIVDEQRRTVKVVNLRPLKRRNP
jgi:hypothetical protein